MPDMVGARTAGGSESNRSTGLTKTASRKSPTPRISTDCLRESKQLGRGSKQGNDQERSRLDSCSYPQVGEWSEKSRLHRRNIYPWDRIQDSVAQGRSFDKRKLTSLKSKLVQAAMMHIQSCIFSGTFWTIPNRLFLAARFLTHARQGFAPNYGLR